MKISQISENVFAILYYLRKRYLWSRGNNNKQIKSGTKRFLWNKSTLYRNCFVWKKRCKLKTFDIITKTKCRCYLIKYAECSVDVSWPLWCKLIQLKPIEVSAKEIFEAHQEGNNSIFIVFLFSRRIDFRFWQ